MSTEAVDTTVSDKAGTIDDFVKCRCRDLQSQTGHVDGSRPHLGCDLSDCPYLYLQRDNFTTEAFKIQLRNVRRYTGFKQLKKMLDGLGVKYRKIKLLQDVTFITFSCAEDRDKAISTLHEYKWRGQLLDARIAIGRADPLLQKRLPAFSETKETESKRTRTSSNDMTGNAEDPADRLRDIVTPLWRLRYDPDQLAEKRTRILSSLSSMRSSVLECNPKLECHLTSSDVDRDVAGGLCICPLLETISSPVTVEYRNKSELTVGCDLDGNEPVIGFRFTKYRDGLTAVGSFHHVNILPKSTVVILDHLQRFIDSLKHSENVCNSLRTYNPIDHQGHWRQVLVRDSLAGSRLLLIDIHPQQLTQDDLQILGSRLREWFSDATDTAMPRLTSLYLSTRTTSSTPYSATNTQLLFGSEYLMERCCGLSFRISLTAFFQVNTLAAELLYQEVARFVTGAYDLRHGRDGDLVTPVDREAKTEANDDSKCQSVLLDVCCGTGTIGLCLSKHFDRVIGIELAQSAVEDARQNARQNNIENVQFYCGRADKILQDVISTLPTDCNIVAVVDPPRSGLHNVVIQCLRRCTRLQRIVFVSCDLDAAAKDFIDFARPTSNRFVGTPFVPVVAKAVDLFPQTRHVEVILLLQRVSE